MMVCVYKEDKAVKINCTGVLGGVLLINNVDKIVCISECARVMFTT